ncbi:MAG TPA: BrnT family toxin [Thermoanaerobaculia bacterium]|jgi:hypothetical protein|nr:BrnT family toxin [Thermoanaerobaculia bacterium]
MRFEWDDAKNDVNLQKHGINFTDVWQVFTEPMLIDLDDREDYGEERWIGTGWLGNLLIVVVWTEPEEDTIRVISARRADRYERRRYEKDIWY